MQRRASSRPGPRMAPVGQASMQALHWPQWAPVGASTGSGRSTRISPMKKVEPASRAEQQRVLAAPAEAGLFGQRQFHHRRRIREHAVAVVADGGADALGQLLQAVAQHLVVVAAARIHRDHGGLRIELAQAFARAPVVRRGARQVVHARHDRAHRARHQLGRPGTLHAVACHIIHLAMVAGVQPGLQAGFVRDRSTSAMRTSAKPSSAPQALMARASSGREVGIGGDGHGRNTDNSHSIRCSPCSN
jgi:hypothetical protein